MSLHDVILIVDLFICIIFHINHVLYIVFCIGMQPTVIGEACNVHDWLKGCGHIMCPQFVISDNTAGRSLFALNFKWSEVVYMTALLRIVQRLTIVNVILVG